MKDLIDHLTETARAQNQVLADQARGFYGEIRPTNAECVLGDSPHGIEPRHVEVARELLRLPTVDTTTERCIARHSDVKPLTVRFRGDITQAEMVAMMRMAGLQLYIDCNNEVWARTVEQGKQDREQAAKRERVEHYRDMESEAIRDAFANRKPL